MVAYIVANKAGITAPSVRWTRLFSQDAVSNLWRVEVWYCVATSSETGATNFVWTDGDANSPMWAAIAAYRGVDQNNPINASDITAANNTANLTSLSTPTLTTTTKAMVLYHRGTRKSSGTTQFSSSIANERFDSGNAGSGAVGYNMAVYDAGSETAAGSIAAVSITAGTPTNITDSVDTVIALQTADKSASAGVATTATAAVYGATVQTGIGANAAVATTATASAKAPSIITGKFGLASLAAATVSVKDVGRRIATPTASATASATGIGAFTGTPAARSYRVPADVPGGDSI